MKKIILFGLTYASYIMLGPAIVAAQTAYSFTNVIDSTGIFATFGQHDLNGDGTLAFFAERDDANAEEDFSTQGLYSLTAGTLTTIVDNDGPYNVESNGLAINGSGQIAFRGRNMGEKIFLYSAGTYTTIVAKDAVNFPNVIGDPAISNNGGVAFMGRTANGSVRGAYVGAGGPLTTIADNSGAINSFSADFAINTAGVVVVGADMDDGSQAIFAGSGGPLSTIANTASGPFNLFHSGPSINSGGDVVVAATLDSGEMGVYKISGGVITTIVDDNGPFDSFFAGPSINNDGVVAFVARSLAGDPGIYTNANGIVAQVIERGDSLFGSTVTQLAYKDIEDSGQLAIGYTLANGVQGIAVASVAIPEPACALLMSLGLMSTTFKRRRYSKITPCRV